MHTVLVALWFVKTGGPGSAGMEIRNPETSARSSSEEVRTGLLGFGPAETSFFLGCNSNVFRYGPPATVCHQSCRRLDKHETSHLWYAYVCKQEQKLRLNPSRPTEQRSGRDTFSDRLQRPSRPDVVVSLAARLSAEFSRVPGPFPECTVHSLFQGTALNPA